MEKYKFNHNRALLSYKGLFGDNVSMIYILKP